MFRIGDNDARALAEGFAHFDTKGLQSLSIGQAIARIERKDNDFNLSVPMPHGLDSAIADTRTDQGQISQQLTAVKRKIAECQKEVTVVAQQIDTAKAEIKKALDLYLQGKAPKAGWINPSDIEPAPLDPKQGKACAKHHGVRRPVLSLTHICSKAVSSGSPRARGAPASRGHASASRRSHNAQDFAV